MLRNIVSFVLLFVVVQGQRGQFYGQGGARFGNNPTSYYDNGASSYLTGGSLDPYGYASGGSAVPWYNQYFQGQVTDIPDEREVLPEWFETDASEDCDKVPNTVNTGRPRDLCKDGDLGQKFCICLKRPAATRYLGQTAPSAGGSYEPICGECRDPCALRFVPDTFPRKKENAADNKDNNNSNNNKADAKPAAGGKN